MIKLAKRKNISKYIRFEVFKRDSFTCQYCGRSAPDVVLEVDHIIPVAKGGDNNITNLITSCFDCNRGKRDKKLTETQIIKASKTELDKLNERKEQLEMISKWRIDLLNIEKEEAKKIIELVNTEININISLTDSGINNMIKLIKKYGFEEILESSVISFSKYDPEVAFKKISVIADIRKKDKENPNLKRIYYIRGILRNRFNYINENYAMQLLKMVDQKNLPLDWVEEQAKNCDSWSDWESSIEGYLLI